MPNIMTTRKDDSIRYNDNVFICLLMCVCRIVITGYLFSYLLHRSLQNNAFSAFAVQFSLYPFMHYVKARFYKSFNSIFYRAGRVRNELVLSHCV